jgi:MFS transporter, PCFT/HCP family, solute carrier family 46, member 3
MTQSNFRQFRFIINTSLMFLSIVYSIFKLKSQTTPKQRSILEIPASKWFFDFFDKNHFKQTTRTLLKKRDNNYRAYIIIVMISMALYAFQRDEKPYLYLYAQLKLGWNLDFFSIFKTYHSAAFVVVMLIAIPIMNKLLKFRDTSIILFGTIAHSLGRIFFIIADGSLVMFIGATVAALGVSLNFIINHLKNLIFIFFTIAMCCACIKITYI